MFSFFLYSLLSYSYSFIFKVLSSFSVLGDEFLSLLHTHSEPKPAQLGENPSSILICIQNFTHKYNVVLLVKQNKFNFSPSTDLKCYIRKFDLAKQC